MPAQAYFAAVDDPGIAFDQLLANSLLDKRDLKERPSEKTPEARQAFISSPWL